MAGIMQHSILIGQLYGTIPTYCALCNELITTRRSKSNFTKKCGCGCDVYTWFRADNEHKICYFKRKFIPKHAYIFKEWQVYDKNYKEKPIIQKTIERLGFEKKELGEKVVFAK